MEARLLADTLSEDTAREKPPTPAAAEGAVNSGRGDNVDNCAFNES